MAAPDDQREPAEGEVTTDSPHRRPFAAWLNEQRKGALHAELSESLAELAAAVVEHGKSGSLQLKISVAPNKDGLSVTVADEVVVKAPQPDRGAFLWFADDRGNLTRSNPNQLDLPLREVGKETA